jgi:hypothetical protein
MSPVPRPPDREETPLTTRQRRLLSAGGVLLIAGLSGTLVWAQTHPGTYGRSQKGCVNLTVPSSLGGAVMHRCGAEAQSWCRSAYAAHDRLDLLVQPECRLAGITPDTTSPAAGTRAP